ncbi:MAG: CoA pyrophosphatase [Sporomusaceae bacterium]|nr:CoA pyrophosphatase [Sporomusaceae bacterium]
MDKDKLTFRLQHYEQQCFQLIDNERDYFSSAVLIPLIEEAGKWSIAFEVRSRDLNWQPGEICLPGGKVEKDDISSAMTAVRETCEELGIQEKQIEVLGSLKCVVSPLGVIICPHVGIVRDFSKISPNPKEVSEVFTVPVEHFFNEKPRRAKMEVATRPGDNFPFELVSPQFNRDWRKRSAYSVLFYTYNDYVIWGLTARVILSFVRMYCQK